MLKILFIEDDAIEVMKFNRVLKTLSKNHEIIEANNGLDALEILMIKKDIPDIIILDLNMPKLNGLEFLAVVKNDDTLKNVPLIILTTSANQRDVAECYKYGIAGYILKPLKYHDYTERIKCLVDYWSFNELISF